MFKFFRKIRVKLLLEGNLKKYLLYAIGEILLVVIGILIALQINNLNEEKKERRLATTYLENLELDLISDLKAIEKTSTDIDFYENEGYYSLDVIEGNITEVDKTRFLKSLIWNNHYPIFQPTRSTYEDLISSGNIKLLKNNDLKVALSKYYLRSDWWEQFEQRAKDTYWYILREEIFKNIDPFIMRAFYESEFYPSEEPSIKMEDIEVDFTIIKTQNSLRDAIARALSLRVWHKNRLREAKNEIENILAVLTIEK